MTRTLEVAGLGNPVTQMTTTSYDRVTRQTRYSQYLPPAHTDANGDTPETS